MANEIRVRQNFLGGLVDTADLSSSGTTLNSAGLAAASTAIGSTTHMPITLDPDGIYGAPEIAYITSLTVGATSATILRGQEGTTARAHLMDTPWVHAPTTNDFGTKQTRVYRSASLTLSAASWTAVSFDAEDFDDLAAHDNATNPTRLIAPSYGRYEFIGQFAFGNRADGGEIYLKWQKNGATQVALRDDWAPSGTQDTTRQCLTGPIQLSAGDYLEMLVYMDVYSGGALPVGADTTWASMSRLMM